MEIVFYSKSSTFWGKNNEGRGANHFGYLLMKMREDLKDLKLIGETMVNLGNF